MFSKKLGSDKEQKRGRGSILFIHEESFNDFLGNGLKFWPDEGNQSEAKTV